MSTTDSKYNTSFSMNTDKTDYTISVFEKDSNGSESFVDKRNYYGDFEDTMNYAKNLMHRLSNSPSYALLFNQKNNEQHKINEDGSYDLVGSKKIVDGYEVINLGGDRYDGGLIYEIKKDGDTIHRGIIDGEEMIEFGGKSYDGLRKLAESLGAELKVNQSMASGGMMEFGGMLLHGFYEGDTILRIYKGYGIVENKNNGVIEVLNPNQGTRFIIDLDDSKSSGMRKSMGMSKAEQIESAKEYIDYLNENLPDTLDEKLQYHAEGQMASGGETENDRALKQLNKLKDEGKLKRYVDVRGNGKKVFDTIVPNKSEKGMYKRYESLSQSSMGTLQNEYLDETDVLNWLKKTMPKQMAKGGELDKLLKEQQELEFQITDIKLGSDLNTEEGVNKYRKLISPIKDKLRSIDKQLDKLGYEPYASGGMMAKGGMVVTSIKDIPNFKERLKEGKITYRGMGMGKKSDNFYDLAGEHGVSIKVDGKEYHITETEFDTFSRGADGKLRIRFAAPYRRSFADGGEVETKINNLYIKSSFFNDDFNWKLKLLEMLQDGSSEAYNIYQSLTESQKQAVLQELFEMDNDMGGEGDGEIETSKENLDILLEDAKSGKKYASGGMMAKGGSTKNRKSIRDLTLEQISSLTNIGEGGIRRFADENNLTDSELSNIMQGIGRGMISKLDFATAISGNKDNSYSKEIVDFAKSGKAYRLADGGKTTVVEDFGSTNFRNQYDEWEMVVISKGLEKDGGQYLTDRYLVSARDIEEAKKIATELWEKGMGNSDFHIVKVMSDSLYRLKYMDVYADGGMMAKGGEIAEYRVTPSKRGQGSLSNFVEADYKMAFTIKGSKQEAEKAAQSFVTENNETHPSATVKKIHPSGQPLKNKKVSYVTRDEITKFADGGMAKGAGETESEDVGNNYHHFVIEYRNPKNKLEKYKKEFKGETAYKQAINWGRKNVRNFNADMVKFYMADGGVLNRDLNIKVRNLATNEMFTPNKLGREYEEAMAKAVVVALIDANFNSEARKLVSILEKNPKIAEKPNYPNPSDPNFKEKMADIEKEYGSDYFDADEKTTDFGLKVSRLAGYDGLDIANAFIYTLKMNGSHRLADKINNAM